MAKKGLGKGMDALFGESVVAKNTNSDAMLVKTAQLEPNRLQPRKKFDEDALSALSASIKEYGVVQPIVVAPQKNGFYEIIAGERRWRAAKMAALKEVPVIIRDCDEKEKNEITLIENLQREDLTAIEEAEGYSELMKKYNLTQEEISEKIGKSRPAIANALRLLGLPDEIKEMLSLKLISGGHARALLGAKNKEQAILLAKRIVEEGLSVRQVEAFIKFQKEKKPVEKTYLTPMQKQIILESQRALGEKLKTKVKIVKGEKKGKIEIEFYDIDHLQTLLGGLNI